MSSKRFPPLTEEEFNSIMDFSLNEEEEEYLFNTSDSSSTSSSSSSGSSSTSSSSSSGSSSTSSSSSSGSSSAHTVESIDSMDEDEDEDEYYSSGQEDEQENATVILDNIPIPVMRNKILEKVECEWMPQKKIKIWCIKNEDIEACVPHIVEEDAIPSFHCFTHFIPASSMAQSPRTFSDILTHNIVGSTAHFSLAFHGAAFSNQENGVSEKPGIGPYDSLFKKETDVCTIGEVLYPKIACFLELVVRECRCHDAMRSTLPLHELFRQKNIAGYRVWYIFSDCTFTPLSAIDAQLRKNRERLGLAPKQKKLSPSGLGEDNELYQAMGDALKYKQMVATTNSRIGRVNREAEEDRDQNKNIKAAKLDEVAKVITTRTEYYNTVVRHCFEDNTAIKKGSEESKRLDNAGIYTRQVIKHIKPYVYGSIINKETRKQMKDEGACKEQLTYKNYFRKHAELGNEMQFGEDVPVHPKGQRLTFPVQELVFRVDVDTMNPEKLKDTPLPWTISFCDTYLDMLEKKGKEKSKQKQKQHSSDLVDRMEEQTLNSFRSLSELREKRTQSYKKKHGVDGELLKPVSALSSSHSVFNRLKSSEELDEENSRIVYVMDEISKRQQEQIKLVTRLRQNSQYISAEERDNVIRLIREEGIMKLNSSLNRCYELTDVAMEVTSTLRELENNHMSAFHEEPCLLPKYGRFASYIGRRLLNYEIVYGCRGHHQLVHNMRLTAMRAAHCHVTDEMYGMPKDVGHMINFGDAGTGKSWFQELCERTMLPGTFQADTSSSARSNNVPRCKDDSVMYKDELGSLDPKKSKSPEDLKRTTEMKTALTSFEYRHNVLSMPKDSDGRRSILDRKAFCIVTKSHQAFIVSANDREKGEEESFWSRFCTNYFPKKLRNNISGRGVDFLQSASTNISSPISNHQHRDIAWMKLEHALHVTAAKGVKLFGLPYPNTIMLSTHWNRVKNRISLEMPSVLEKPRIDERVSSHGVTECINLAVNTMYTMPEVSDLISVDELSKEVKVAEFSVEQIALLAPLFFLPEDAAIYIITEHVQRYLIPSIHHETLLKIANEKCNYYTAAQGRPMNSSPKYVSVRLPNGEEQFDKSWLTLSISKADLYRYLEGDFNNFIAREIIDDLCNTKVRTRDIPINSELEYAPSVYNTFNPKITHAMRIIEPTTVVSDVCTVLINVQYLDRFSPRQVIDELVMSTICHSGIRPRTVLLGVPYEAADEAGEMTEFPFLLRPYNLVPNPNVKMTTNDTNAVRDQILAKMTSTSTMTMEARVHAESLMSESRITDLSGKDIETYLCEKWLREIVLVTDERSISLYLPHSMDQVIDGIHGTSVYEEQNQVDYPEEFAKVFFNSKKAHEATLAAEPSSMEEVQQQQQQQVVTHTQQLLQQPSTTTPTRMQVHYDIDEEEEYNNGPSQHEEEALREMEEAEDDCHARLWRGGLPTNVDHINAVLREAAAVSSSAQKGIGSSFRTVPTFTGSVLGSKRAATNTLSSESRKRLF